ncbi:hypothetical protein [Neobacillus soli]|uniref:hypothetical protein n=1 Tax=Neobacillus soli TaxID=220688 RepID=UPI0008243420|nr:hypothetical protein [Neobacillus soli]
MVQKLFDYKVNHHLTPQDSYSRNNLILLIPMSGLFRQTVLNPQLKKSDSAAAITREAIAIAGGE